MELRLPQDKLARLKQLVLTWCRKKECRKRDLLSVIGVLSHAYKVIKAGRSFLIRLIDLSKAAKRPEHFIRLNRQAKSDLEWWLTFANSWNGVSMMFNADKFQCSVAMALDASGMRGIKQKQMVPAKMAGQHARVPHHSERTSASCVGSSCLGQAIGR